MTTEVDGKAVEAETTTAQTANPKIEALDEDYVRRLRKENKENRQLATDYKERLEALEAQSKADKESYQSQLSEFSTKAQVLIKERAMDNLERHFEKLNIRDLEFLKLIPEDKLSFDENGKLLNGTELAEEYKSSKPEWFKRTQTSSSAIAPPPAKAEKLDASKLSPEEYQAERKRQFGY